MRGGFFVEMCILFHKKDIKRKGSSCAVEIREDVHKYPVQ